MIEIDSGEDGIVKGKSRVTMQCTGTTIALAPVLWTLDGDAVGNDNDLRISFNNATLNTMIVESFKSNSQDGFGPHTGDWRCRIGGILSKKLTLTKASKIIIKIIIIIK